MTIILRYVKGTRWCEYARDFTGTIYARGSGTSDYNESWKQSLTQDISLIKSLNIGYGWNEVAIDYNYHKNNQCQHEYIQYVGFKEIYNFCKKCDKKAS